MYCKWTNEYKNEREGAFVGVGNGVRLGFDFAAKMWRPKGPGGLWLLLASYGLLWLATARYGWLRLATSGYGGQGWLWLPLAGYGQL